MLFWLLAPHPAAPICSPGILWWCRTLRLRKRIRLAAEKEERELYDHRASDEWLDALAPLGTDADKPFLETAPALIAIFLKKVTIDADGAKHKNYYTLRVGGYCHWCVDYRAAPSWAGYADSYAESDEISY